MKTFILSSLVLLFAQPAWCQSPPWERPLQYAWSADGITFSTPAIFQDSSGVPSVIRWKGDTLISAFQWFRGPVGAPTWDRVAVKFSYDNGLSWTQPSPIVVNGLPSGYQRPFDPTLMMTGQLIRIYFSSSATPSMFLDSTVNTYSAYSTDGINYTFDANPRVDELNGQVIDPALILFKNLYHYAAPAGSPQQGAYHYVSNDGLSFSKVPGILSDPQHNWTGNYMVNDTGELRFYGSGNYIWYNSSPNGGAWNGYVNTNINGGDPSVLRVDSNIYLMVYVGQPYGWTSAGSRMSETGLFPNPAQESVTIRQAEEQSGSAFHIYDLRGVRVMSGKLEGRSTFVSLSGLRPGLYFLETPDGRIREKLVIR